MGASVRCHLCFRALSQISLLFFAGFSFILGSCDFAAFHRKFVAAALSEVRMDVLKLFDELFDCCTIESEE